MPNAPARACSCGRVVPSGERCRCRVARDRLRPTAAARGYGAKWRRESAAWLAVHPVCAYCGRPAEMVDHRVPHKGDMRLFWDRANWVASCRSCNSRKCATSEGGFGR